MLEHGIVCFQLQRIRKVQGGRQGPRNAQLNHQARWREVCGRTTLEKWKAAFAKQLQFSSDSIEVSLAPTGKG